jgi:UDP-galactopyranose mutase
MPREYPIVVFSPRRWDFVYQRPRHLFSRLATRHPVFFIEEPEYEAGAETARWERDRPDRNVTVYRPRTASTAPGFHPEQVEALERLMPQLREDLGPAAPVVWLYTPLALPLLRHLEPAAVVYDCVEEVSSAPGALPGLAAREAELLERADLVFTGGPSLDRAKRGRHPNMHCFPSSVDGDHFGRARPRRPRGVRSTEPADQDGLPHPRLGFYGLIDRRLDLELLGAVADARPDWQLVLVGPVVGIDPATLPRHRNIHYFGQRTYGELPAYLGGWDVCLLPFALTDATRFLSPAKTLEYMAAERPIVSTPIPDVAEPYGDIVRLGASPAEFVAACEAALAESDEEHTHRVGRMREVLGRTSWDATAAAMERLVSEIVARRPADQPV